MITKLNDNAEKILSARYYVDENEDWPALCKRVTDNVVPVSCKKYTTYTDEEISQYTQECFDFINNLYFIPNSPTLFNAGTHFPMLSACFIIDVPDSLEGIFDSIKESAIIHKMGGGVGFSIARLRTRGSHISTTHGKSSGSVSFLRAFSDGTRPITAGGKRKGANMCMMPVWHGDIEEFISAKLEEGVLDNFNLSVQLTDAFMSAVEKDEDFVLIDPATGVSIKTVKAKDIMSKIVYGAWKNGEPGACFIDTVNADNPTPHLGPILSSNPCAEFFSIPYNACNLGSLNLSNYVKEGQFDWDLYVKHIKLATFYLECIIDANRYPLDKIADVATSTRPIGLGVMGFADALIKMGIKYDSGAGFGMAERLAEYLSYYSLEASIEMAQKRGSYKEFRPENHSYAKQTKYGRLNWKALVRKLKKLGVRNSHTTVIAPTGTIARIANEASFGIEPLFALKTVSKILDGSSMEAEHQLYKEFKDGTLKVTEDVFILANDIDWKDHIEMQAKWQTFVHNGISKTVNMKEGTTEADVAGVYMYAYKNGLKGITLYIAGSRKEEVIVSAESDKAKKAAQDKNSAGAGRRPKEIDLNVLKKLAIEKDMTANELSEVFDCSISTIRRRLKELNLPVVVLPDKIRLPDEIDCKRFKIPTPAGKAFIEIGYDEDTKMPIETIISMSKSGSYDNAMAEALGKMISKALQHRMDPYEVIDTISDIVGGDNVEWWDGKCIKSVPDAVAKALSTYITKYAPIRKKRKKPAEVITISNQTITPSARMVSAKKCPSCGSELVSSEGCWKCFSCDWSKCG
jgi:ribonucleoside-diphosphate reductase alpha chain